MKDFKIAVVILGRPGSGKDTQADLLAKKFGLIHIISSRLIERALKSRAKGIKLEGKVYNLARERRLQESGLLNTPAFVSSLVKSEIKAAAARGRGLVMSGSPRTLAEYKAEWPLLEKLYGKNLHAFDVAIGQKEVYKRNLKRRRKDLPELDTEKIIKKRLAVFTKQTWPVIKLLKSKKLIADIDGERPIKTIHQDILCRLQSKQKKK